MSEDIGNKIKQVAELLGQDKIPDNIVSFISDFVSSKSQSNTEDGDERHGEHPSHKTKADELGENLEMARKIKNVLGKITSNNDPRIHLLTAVKPFLSGTKQSKINTCIKILRMSSVAQYFDDFIK